MSQSEQQTNLSETSSSPEHEPNGSLVNPKAVCAMCKRLYRNPRILPCLHTFCSDCIGQLEPFSAGPATGTGAGVADVTVLCPSCDSEVEIPRSGPDGLSVDHLALDEVFRETLLTDGPLWCDLCGDGSAESRCEVCCLKLCEFCCQAHRRQKRTSAHPVQSLRELKSRGGLSRPVLCLVHADRELALFCVPCDLPVCCECAATLHREHRCCPARDVAGRHGDRIRGLVAGQLRPRLERLQDSLQKVEISQEALQTQVDAAANEVRAFARGYASAVEAHCLSLLHRLEEIRVTRRNQLHLREAQLRQALLDVGSGVEFAERLLGRGTDAEVLSAKGVTLRRLSSLAEGPGPDHPLHLTQAGTHRHHHYDEAGFDFSFLPAEPAGEVDGYPLVGVINDRTLDVGKCTVEGEGLQKATEAEQGQFTVLCRDSAGERMTRGGEHVLVSIVHKEKKNLSVQVSVVDNGDGSYGVSYTPQQTGSYSVWVCVKAQHVKGSPFTLSVQKRFRRHGGTFHCCSFCSSGGAKDALCGCTGTMPGGFKGCGHGHKGHPGKPHWSCCGSCVERSQCLPQSVVSAVSPRGHLRTVEL